MKYHLIASQNKEEIDLCTDRSVRLVEMSGVGMNCTVNLSDHSGDGAAFNSARIPSRNISILVQFVEFGAQEKAKQRLYRVFQPKVPIMLRYISDMKDVYIVGYCESVDIPPNKFPLTAQISILCADPYWKRFGSNTVHLFGVSPSFEFVPKSTEFSSIEFGNTKTSQITTIDYTGDFVTGATFIFNIKSDCPYLGLLDIDSGKKMIVNADFESGDVLKICTVNRQKSVILYRRNKEYDYFIHLQAGSEFLQLSNGKKRFKVIIGKGGFAAATVRCEYETLSGGV